MCIDDDRDEHSFDFYETAFVGSCEVCGGDICKFEHILCDCGRNVHNGCTETCEHTGEVGCRGCMIEDDNGWFICEEAREEYIQSLCDVVKRTGSLGDLQDYNQARRNFAHIVC